MSYGATDRGSWRRVEWKYDARGRRLRQTAYILTNGAWQVVEDLKLISDPGLFGRHVAELNATNNNLIRAYIWGLDLSEILDGAGFVGGLLWVRNGTGPASGTHFVCFDGNGNVWNLVSASSGTETARYEYGPFGEPLRLSGAAARSNPFRFSTKRTEDFTGLVLYEYRAYCPRMGRWFSLDPVGELGGVNAHGFALNNPIAAVDPLGQRGWPAGAGQLCVDKKCNAKDLQLLRYLPEDDNTTLLKLPAPGNCVDADAFYAPGFAWTIPDNGLITVVCDKCGSLTNIKYRKWPWWIGSGPIWEVGQPKPPEWPGDIPPYPNEPPE